MRKALLAVVLAVSIMATLTAPALAHICVDENATTGAAHAAVELNPTTSTGQAGVGHNGNSGHVP